MPFSGGGFLSLDRLIKVDFDHTSSSPVSVATQDSDEIITEADVVFTTAFDDVATTAALGSPSSPGLIFGTTELKPKRMGQFHSEEIIEAIVATAIQLTLNPGTSTAGAGFVVVQLQKV